MRASLFFLILIFSGEISRADPETITPSSTFNPRVCQDLLSKDRAPLRNRDLMRVGNEALAFENLDRFLRAYWTDFIFGRDSGWMEKQTLFVIELAEARPRFVRTAWAHALSAKLPHLVNLPVITREVRQTTDFLRSFITEQGPMRLSDRDLVAKWSRLKFIDRLVADLDVVPKSFGDFINLKFTPQGPNRENSWQGLEVEKISPSQVIVFLYRLARYTGMSSPELSDFARAIDVLRPLLEIYPRGN